MSLGFENIKLDKINVGTIIFSRNISLLLKKGIELFLYYLSIIQTK